MLAPFAEHQLKVAQAREIDLILDSFSHLTPEQGAPQLQAYDLQTGSGADFGLPPAAYSYFIQRPDGIWRQTATSEHIFKRISDSERFYRITLPLAFYSDLLLSAKRAVLSVLIIVYLLAVLLLELLILPRYVYQPLRLMLEADAASQAGDRSAEIIGAALIPGDEIGQIMRSRNATLARLRAREDELDCVARDLLNKNQQLEAAKRHLEAQDRLVSLGLLSASVAHEINTPLAVLHGSIDKLLETNPDLRTRGRLERMQRVAERLRRISASLLDFARVRRREFEPIVLKPLIDEAWQLVAIDDASSEVHFDNRIPVSASVRGNPDQLIQVFVNLLRNSLNAVAPSGSISVSSRLSTIDGRPAHAIQFADNGPGIPPEVLPDIFEAFVTTRLDARGTGLGLTIAAGIADQHGGSIAASNRAGGGACLEVTLPAAPPASEPQP
jgi:two-component system NtrC family sensor kinase